MFSYVDKACLERLFLEPAVDGPVRSVDLEGEAGRRLREDLGCSRLSERLANSLPDCLWTTRRLEHGPDGEGEPDYLALLVLTCAVMTETGDADGKRVFWQNFGDALRPRAWNRSHWGGRGIPLMWEHLARWLAREHDVQLDIVKDGPANIGSSYGLTFPTWRDRSLLRRVLPPDGAVELDDDAVAYALADMVPVSKGAFEAHLAEWSIAVRRREDPSSLPFAKVLRNLREERGIGGVTLVLLRETWGFEACLRDEDGSLERVRLDDVSDRTDLRPKLREALRRKRSFWLRDEGYGHWVFEDRREKADAIAMSTEFLQGSSSVQYAATSLIGRDGTWRFYSDLPDDMVSREGTRPDSRVPRRHHGRSTSPRGVSLRPVGSWNSRDGRGVPLAGLGYPPRSGAASRRAGLGTSVYVSRGYD